MKNIDLRVWEDNWNENGLPLKSEFHDFTTQPGIKEGVNAALRMVDAGQLQDKFPLAAAQALQKVHNSLNAAARQPQAENDNTLYQIGELIKSAAPLIGQALGAVMGGTGAEGGAGGPANEIAGTAASGAAMPAAQPIPELRTFEHRIGDGSGMPDNPIHRGTDELPQLTPVSASGSATDFSGGAGGSGSVGGSVGSGADPSTGGTAGPSAGPVPVTGFAPISAPSGEGYPGGGTPSGGAGFGNQGLPSDGGYPGGVVRSPGGGADIENMVDPNMGQTPTAPSGFPSLQMPDNLAEQRYRNQVSDSEQNGVHLDSKMGGADSEAGKMWDRDLEFPDSVKGTPEFYKHLAEYYEQKYGEAPDYLMEYGDKYAREFSKIESELSPEGKEWVRNTMRGLQDKMMKEIKKDPSIIHDQERFRDMAFETHSDAYLEGGLRNVPNGDLLKITQLPDGIEWIDWRTWKEAGEVVPYVVGPFLRRILENSQIGSPSIE